MEVDSTLVDMSHLLSDDQVVAAYLELRSRVVALLRTLSDEQGSIVVPSCPAWAVADVAAHIVGVPEDIVAGRMEGVTSEAWTQAQVDRHRGASPRDLADRLERSAESFDESGDSVRVETYRGDLVEGSTTGEGSQQVVAIDLRRIE